MNIAKDSFLLLLAGIFCAGLAWVFWYFLGNDGFVVITLISILGLGADNYRLRRRLHDNSRH